jgi:hypothetical protein
MTKMLGMTLVLIAGGAAANGDFWHPDTNQVVFAANGGDVSVCAYRPVYQSSGALKTEWTCYPHSTYGARAQVIVDLPLTGETRVIGARWAYAADESGALSPMSKD